MDVSYRDRMVNIAAEIRRRHPVNTEPLIRFWEDNFKVQVQARTSNIEVHQDEGLSVL